MLIAIPHSTFSKVITTHDIYIAYNALKYIHLLSCETPFSVVYITKVFIR